ncbi:MAG TPA: response regulator [Bacteriovoracaceae bacterium]|nr:response regulator [Bacteriovoracaceae bacterium]
MKTKPHILIVDDHPENLLAMRAVLESPNYEITECSSGMDALRCLLCEHYDLILMDVHMPELDGFATATLIRERPKTQAIPLIFVTAQMMDEESTLKGYKTGCADYITKPFNPETLKKKVEFFLSYSNKIRIEQKKLDIESEYEKVMKVFNELINPLWSVLLNVQLLKKYSKSDNKKVYKTLTQKLECIEDSTQQLNKMIGAYRNEIPKLLDLEKSYPEP